MSNYVTPTVYAGKRKKGNNSGCMQKKYNAKYRWQQKKKLIFFAAVEAKIKMQKQNKNTDPFTVVVELTHTLERFFAPKWLLCFHFHNLLLHPYNKILL